jgi:hypothetical protein
MLVVPTNVTFICVESMLLFAWKENKACFPVFNPKCGFCQFWSRTKEGDDLPFAT